jgi:hypothetical protein
LENTGYRHRQKKNESMITCSGRNAKISALLVLVGICLLYKVNVKSVRLQFNKLYANEIHVKPNTTTEDDARDDEDGPCSDYHVQAEPILLPPSPDASLIDRLRESMGNVTFEHNFSHCLPTSQVQLIPKCPFWELQTLDNYGNKKMVGGDEFYITYTDKPLHQNNINDTRPLHTKPFTAAAFVTDFNNGRYQLDFQASPFSEQIHSGEGIVAVYFQYTCRIGRMGPPSKAGWNNGGNSVAAYQTEMLTIAPPIREFEVFPTRLLFHGISSIMMLLFPWATRCSFNSCLPLGSI